MRKRSFGDRFAPLSIAVSGGVARLSPDMSFEAALIVNAVASFSAKRARRNVLMIAA